MSRLFTILLALTIWSCDDYKEPIFIEPAAKFYTHCRAGEIMAAMVMDSTLYTGMTGTMSFWISTTSSGKLALDTIIHRELAHCISTTTKINNYQCAGAYSIYFDGRGVLPDGTKILICKMMTLKN